ncbi:hypothetical protein TREES_T100003218 [Tupaia chinensis]|uniref:Uncharacterized protein n=1 Tax=Tupaia chinensis TaxID=246437 RepID=L9K2W9_TUPCH|nr:hypothetical protein TREES_T100003218 [Tupaia chinensis]
MRSLFLVKAVQAPEDLLVPVYPSSLCSDFCNTLLSIDLPAFSSHQENAVTVANKSNAQLITNLEVTVQSSLANCFMAHISMTEGHPGQKRMNKGEQNKGRSEEQRRTEL